MSRVAPSNLACPAAFQQWCRPPPGWAPTEVNVDKLREAAEAAEAAWDRWIDSPEITPSCEMWEAMAGLGEALRITDGWRILPASTPNLTAAEYAAYYFGVE